MLAVHFSPGKANNQGTDFYRNIKQPKYKKINLKNNIISPNGIFSLIIRSKVTKHERQQSVILKKKLDLKAKSKISVKLILHSDLELSRNFLWI